MGLAYSAQKRAAARIKEESALAADPFSAGVQAGALQLRSTYNLASAAIGQATGNEQETQKRFEKSQELGTQAEPFRKGRPTDIESIKSFGDFIDYSKFQLGNMVPSALESLGAMAIGGLAGAVTGSAIPVAGTAAGGVGGAAAGFFGKVAMKKYAEKKIGEYLAKGMTKELAEKKTKQAIGATVGANLTNFANSYVQGVGEIYGETFDENTKKGDLMSTFLGSVPYAALDSFVEMSLLGKSLKGSEGSSAVSRFSKALFSGAAKEGTSEALQEADIIIAGLNSGKEYSTDDVISRLGNSFAAAAIGGGVLGIPGGRKSEAQKAQETPATTTPTEVTPTTPVSTQPVTKEETAKVVQTVTRQAPVVKEAIVGAIDAPITIEQLSGLSDEQIQVLGATLKMIKQSSPEIDSKNIDASLATIVETGVELPVIGNESAATGKESVVVKTTGTLPVQKEEKPTVQEQIPQKTVETPVKEAKIDNVSQDVAIEENPIEVKEEETFTEEQTTYIKSELERRNIKFDKNAPISVLKQRLEESNAEIPFAKTAKLKTISNTKETRTNSSKALRDDINARKEKGEISEKDVRILNKAIDSFENNLKGVSFAIQKTDSKTAGFFDYISDTITISNRTFENDGDYAKTVIHEIWHALSSKLDPEFAAKLDSEFRQKKAHFLKKFPETDGMNKEQLNAWLESDNAPEEAYRFKNLDEFFAVTMTEYSLEEFNKKYNLENKNILSRVFAFLKETLKTVFQIKVESKGPTQLDVLDSFYNAKEKKVLHTFLLESAARSAQTEESKIKRKSKTLEKAVSGIESIPIKEKQNIVKSLREGKMSIKDVSNVIFEHGVSSDDLFGILRSTGKPQSKMFSKISVAKVSEITPELKEEYKKVVKEIAEVVDAEREAQSELSKSENLFDDEQENQYSKFKKTVTKYTGEKAKEVFGNGDVDQLKKFLVGRGWEVADVDNMLYSSEMSDNEILDVFRNQLNEESPGILHGKKVAKELGLGKKLKQAKEFLESGRGAYSSDYMALQARKTEIEFESLPFKEKKRALVSDNGELRVKNTFNEVWKKLYGTEPSGKISTLIEENATSIASAMAKLSFSKGKELERDKARGKVRVKLWQQSKRFKREKEDILSKAKKKEYTRANLRKVLLQLTDDFPKNVRNRILSQERIFNIRTGKHLSDVLDSIEKAKVRVLLSRELAERRRAVAEIIKQKDLKRDENLRRAMKLPVIDKMNTEELEIYATMLNQFQEGDTFLSQRAIELAPKTDIPDVKTIREAREKLQEETGVEELAPTKIGASNYVLSDSGLYNRGALLEVMTTEYHKTMLAHENEIVLLDDKTNKLFEKARGSRKDHSLSERMIPTDKRIFDYLSSDDKAEAAKDLTTEEMEAAMFVKEHLDEYYKTGVREEILGKSRFEGKYVPNIMRGFLEAFKDSGLTTAIKELYESSKHQEETAAIISGADMSQKLAYQKFFNFKLFRTGEVTPTKNVAKAFLIYAKAFHKKQAIDAITPKIMIYTQAIKSQEKTEKGLDKDPGLEKFVKEWLNMKRGRAPDVMSLIPQFSMQDMVLKGLITLTRLKDLGLSVAGPLSNIGEQGMNYVQMGAKKYAIGYKRIHSAKGKRIVEKNRGFVGKNPWKNLSEASDTAANTAAKGLMVFFEDARIRANKQFLLGMLTDAEWKNEEISPKRLAQLKLEMGRWRTIEDSSSIAGKTSAAKALLQYKSWATPIARTAVSHMLDIKKDPKLIKERQGQELTRAFVVLSTIGFIVTYLLLDDEEDKKNPIVRAMSKAAREFFSATGSLSLKFWLAMPRIADFANDQWTWLVQMVLFFKEENKYQQSKKGEYKKGDYKFINSFLRANSPTVVNQFK
jgi:hypothetical protein